MPPSILVVIREDPIHSARAVEALRIALGLSTGNNPLTVILLNQAPLLLSQETDSVADGDILEKHLPVFKELQTSFIVPEGTRSRFSLDSDFQIREASPSEIAQAILQADRVLAF